MTRESCASRLKIALKLSNMKQIELCDKTKIPKSAMSQYISGAFEPKQDRVFLIAKALNVSEAWLMGYDVPMKRTIDEPKPLRSIARLENNEFTTSEDDQISDFINFVLGKRGNHGNSD